MVVIDRKYDISDIINYIEIFYQTMKDDKNSSNFSWEYCYYLFHEQHETILNQNIRDLSAIDVDYLSLNLAFYLCSWGMYRGKAFLKEKDYKIHETTVKTIFKTKYNSLWSIDPDILNDDSRLESIINLIFDATEEIKACYNDNQPSDILLTKIMMGTFGCIPAYDNYFLYALKDRGLVNKYTKESLMEIFMIYKNNREILDTKKTRIDEQNNPIRVYPPMKLIDMCFWFFGKENKPK